MIKKEWIEDEYPEELITSLDKQFPKGDKRRGHALVIQAIAFLEGKKIERARTERIINKRIKEHKACDKLDDYEEQHMEHSVILAELKFIKKKLKIK